MQRRSFLSGLVALAAPAIIRTPGLLMPVKTIILPRLLQEDEPKNTLLTINMIAREVAALWVNSNTLAASFPHSEWDGISIRLPVDFGELE